MNKKNNLIYILTIFILSFKFCYCQDSIGKLEISFKKYPIENNEIILLELIIPQPKEKASIEFNEYFISHFDLTYKIDGFIGNGNRKGDFQIQCELLPKKGGDFLLTNEHFLINNKKVSFSPVMISISKTANSFFFFTTIDEDKTFYYNQLIPIKNLVCFKKGIKIDDIKISHDLKPKKRDKYGRPLIYSEIKEIINKKITPKYFDKEIDGQNCSCIEYNNKYITYPKPQKIEYNQNVEISFFDGENKSLEKLSSSSKININKIKDWCWDEGLVFVGDFNIKRKIYKQRTTTDKMVYVNNIEIIGEGKINIEKLLEKSTTFINNKLNSVYEMNFVTESDLNGNFEIPKLKFNTFNPNSLILAEYILESINIPAGKSKEEYFQNSINTGVFKDCKLGTNVH